MLILKTNRLRVEAAEPPELRDRTTRFDHAAFIRQVTLDDSMTFCAEEPFGPGGINSGGQGLCSEFQPVSAETSGNPYILKMGVGLLKKRCEEPYNPFQRYVYIPSNVAVEQGSTFLRFISVSTIDSGNVLVIRRSIEVEDNKLMLQTGVENSGSEELKFREYCHNFLSMNGRSLGPGYCLELPDVNNLHEYVKQNVRAEHMFRSEEHRLHVAAHITKPVHFSVDGAGIADRNAFSWRLSHVQTGGWVEGTAHFHPSGVTVWAKDNVFCPEVFYQSSLQPGESCTWQRTWTFGRDL